MSTATTYHLTAETHLSFDKAVEKVTAELAKEGFGILTRIDVRETMKKKLDVDFRPYVILGACNPPFALRALEAEPNVGLLLPCNVVVQKGKNGVEVSAIDPLVAMASVANANLAPIATEVRAKLFRVIEAMSEPS